jgi:uncharacterized membrane protein YecN with MAPEG domain
MNKPHSPRLSWRERYRLVVSLLIIPLGLIIIVRAALFGIQGWALIVLGAALVGLGVVRLWAYVQRLQHTQAHGKKAVSRRKRG